MSKIIAVNAGSSTLKFKLFEMPEERLICSGMAENIGLDNASFKIEVVGKDSSEFMCQIKDHAIAVSLLLESLTESGIIKDLNEIKGVGHRVVQGGQYFSHSEIVTKDVEDKVESLIPLAPLHNAAHLIGYRAFKQVLPDVKNVFVFDTAFHQTMEAEDYLYACKYEYYEKYHVRKYGAHGTSHQYLFLEAKRLFADNPLKKVITCHIGSGASLCAIKDGKCVATSMGLTPLAGVMMGTRTGDIDPSVMPYLIKQTGKDAETLYQEFNKESGLRGISGISSDTRPVEKAALDGDPRAILATKMYARRIADYIGQYFVRLGGCDLIIFSAGVGENSPFFRKLIVDDIKEALNVELNDELNNITVKGKYGLISSINSMRPIAVIPTNEELMIVRDTVRLLNIK